MKIEELGNDMIRLTADEGKYLYNRLTKKTYSEAITKKNKAHYFSEVDAPVTEEETAEETAQAEATEAVEETATATATQTTSKKKKA